MTVRTRLVVSFAVVAALLAVPALFAALRLAELRDLATVERGRHATAVLTLGRMETALAELDRLERSYVITGEAGQGGRASAALGRVEEGLVTLRGSRYAAAAAGVAPTVERLGTVHDRIDGLVAAGDLGAATEAFADMEPLFGAVRQGLSAVADRVDTASRRDFERARTISASALTLTLAGLGGALLAAILLGAWTTRALTRPIRRLASATSAVAEGGFEAPRDLPYSRADEIGALARAFRIMTYRLSDLDRMKAEFVGVASHELKNPVNVVQGYAELLEDGIPGELNERQHEMVRAVGEQARIMARLIERLMDISRLEAGTYELDVGPVAPDELLAGLVRAFRVLAEREGIELVTTVEPSAPESFEADGDLLRDEVLGNLVSNALRHTPEGGTVTVRVLGEGADVVLEVSDTGPGIPPEERRHVFDRYYQVERAGKGGAGLGLAVAREMVEAHGGTIQLDPDRAPGATFRVVLPAEGAAVREPTIHGSTGIPGPGAGRRGGGASAGH